MLQLYSIIIVFSSETHELLLISEISSRTITIVGLMLNGTRLFTIHYDGSEIQSNGYDQLLSRIQPAYFLADFQLTRWPSRKIRDRLMRTSTCFQENLCSFEESIDGSYRSLNVDGERIFDISINRSPSDQSSIKLNNFERSYSISLEPTLLDF